MKPKNLLSPVLSLLFPPRCPFCRRVLPVGEMICEACSEKLPQVTYRKYTVGYYPCCAPLPYRDAYAAAVKRFKFSRKRTYAQPLGLLVIAAAKRAYHDLSRFDCVTCVPMHKTTMRRRRFNQAELLARECAALAGLPYRDTLIKLRQNVPQHTLKRDQRAENVRGVFAVSDPSLVRGKRVLLIDDIITTGNTLGECAHMLHDSGCREVCCAVVCATRS